MAAKLKVYATRIGFHDTVVAAPSQKAALAAWDVRENLFAQGAAAVTEDPAATQAALARPGVVLRRPAGSDAAFSETPDAPAVPRLKRPAGKAPKSAEPARAKPPADRSALDAAERALADLDREAKAARRSLDERRRSLEAEAEAFEHDLDARRRKLEQARDRARRAYDRPGGR